MAQYDLETFLRDLGTVFKNNLNTEIAAINAEKGDFTIDTINDDAWYFQYIPNVFSYDVNIAWGLDVTDIPDTQPEDYIKTPKVDFEVIMPDLGELSTQSMFYKHLRYMRALETVAFKNFDKFQGVAKLRVQDLLPTSFVWSGKTIRSAGISVSASFSTY